MRRIPEETVCRLIGYKGGHCQSCHEDMEKGWAPMVTVDLGRGRFAEVCCVVFAAFERWRYGRECVPPGDIQ